MKKILLLTISLLIIITALFSQTTIAIFPYDAMDSSSKSLKTQFEKIDIPKTFGEDSYFKLIDNKEISKIMKSELGSAKLYETGKETITGMGATLNADLVLIGTISSLGNNNFSISTKIFNVSTQNISTVALNVNKVSKDRRDLIMTDLIPKIKAFFDTEKVKAMNIAIQNYEQKKLEIAKSNFEDIHRIDPNNFEAVSYLARIAFEEKDYAKCEEWAKLGLSMNPKSEDIARLLGGAYQNQGKLDEAAEALTPIAKANNDVDIWYYIGNMYATAQENDKAIQALNEAVKIDANHAQANYRLGLIYVSREDYSAALPCLEIAANAYPEDGAITEKLALAYKKTGNLLKSIENQESVLASNPNDYQLYLKLNNAYIAAGLELMAAGDKAQADLLFEKGIATLKKLEALNNENPLLYISLAHTYNTKGDIKNAEIAANKAIEIDSNNYASYMILAQIYFQKGSTEYNNFSELEMSFSKAMGKEADRLKIEKDNAQQKTIQLFNRSKEYYNDALAKAGDPMREASIRNSIKEVENYITSTSKN
ncbi:MAG: tetratricopeptide repeat protein [Candidatus Cloacimonetes bacterium]|nr:tetratricopeptide repeat protein [Candidatus Cloacimonadota bacterium]